MSLGSLTSDVFLFCEPTVTPITGFITATATATVTSTFTKVWEWTAPAACPTGEWMATYSIEQICTGDPNTWTQPAIPPNFIETVVYCDVCDRKTQTITCPVEEAAQTGDVKIQGNGVTATPASVPAQATGTSDMGSNPGAAGQPGSGAGAGSADPAPNAGSIAGPDSPPSSGSGSSAAPDSGSGAGAAAPADGSPADPASPTGADATGSPYVTAGAPTLQSAVLLVSGMFALVSSAIVW